MLRNVIVVVALLAATPVAAQQFQIGGSIRNAVQSDATSYTGPGSPLFTTYGSAFSGNRGALDVFGQYRNIGGLLHVRQTETLTSLNTIRFFDSFTNTSAATITQTVEFIGNLGSDSRTKSLIADPNGLWVTCEAVGVDNTGACSTGIDPVLATVFGNNGLAQAGFGDPGNLDNFSATYQLTVAPGQTVSLLNFVFMVSQLSGTAASDQTLAQTTGRAIQASPYTQGLTSTQVAQVVNFGGAVPEPSTWAMMITGFGAMGWAVRRRRRVAAIAA